MRRRGFLTDRLGRASVLDIDRVTLEKGVFTTWFARYVATNTVWPRAFQCCAAHPGRSYAVGHLHRFESMADAVRWRRDMLLEIEARHV